MSTRVVGFSAASLLVVSSWAVPAAAEKVDGDAEAPTATTARSTDVELGTAAPHGVRRHWYGWQTLTSDGIAIGLIVGSFAFGNGDANGVTLAGVGTFALGPPVIHVAHERYLAALGSLSLRIGLPALAIAYASQPCLGECGAFILGALWLGSVAVIAPIALDAALFGWETEEWRSVPSKTGLRSLRPTVTVGREGLVFGVYGWL